MSYLLLVFLLLLKFVAVVFLNTEFTCCAGAIATFWREKYRLWVQQQQPWSRLSKVPKLFGRITVA